MEKIRKTAIILLVSFFSSSLAYAQEYNFSGVWEINLTKSLFGEVPTYTASKALNIIQSVNGFIIKATYIPVDGKDSTYVHTYNLDGRVTLISRSDGLTAKVTMEFAADGKSIKVNTLLANTNTRKNLELIKSFWSINDERNTLTIINDAENVDGRHYHTRVVYDKK